MSAKVIDGREIAKKIRLEVASEVKKLKSEYDVSPSVTTVKVGSDPGSELYMKLRDKACNEVGIDSKHLVFAEDASEGKVIQEISELNEDDGVHGVLVQYPVPGHINPLKLMNAVCPEKDIEGFNPYNMGRTLIGDEHIIPCTPQSVLTILEYEKIDLEGKDVVIVNHSNVVGKPLSALFLNRNATVSVCHIFTKDSKKYTKEADILISAAGKPKLITNDHIKSGAFVIDVGIVQTSDGICGDVDFEKVKEKAGWITPVPGGVGPVTVACSLKNMIKTYKNCHE